MITRQIALGLGLTGIILFSTKAYSLSWPINMGRCHQSFALKNGFFAPFLSVFLPFIRIKKNNLAVKNDYLWVLLFGFLGYYLASYFDFKGLEYIKAKFRATDLIYLSNLCYFALLYFF